MGGVYARVATRHGLTLDAAELESRFRSVWKEEKKAGRPIDKPWWRNVVLRVFPEARADGFDALFEDIYGAFNQTNAWRVFPDVLPTLRGLKERGVRLAVASNWDERLPQLLAALGLAAHFERLFYSHAMGVAKPDPAFFRRALTDAGVDPIEAIHVGDDENEDIAAAQAAGLRAYHIDRAARPKNSRALVNLEEVLLRV